MDKLYKYFVLYDKKEFDDIKNFITEHPAYVEYYVEDNELHSRNVSVELIEEFYLGKDFVDLNCEKTLKRIKNTIKFKYKKVFSIDVENNRLYFRGIREEDLIVMRRRKLEKIK